MRKWLYFVNERFSPLSYAVMITVFLGAHYALYSYFVNQNNINNSVDILQLVPLGLATALFFFKLRLLDEVKDMESDAIHHPERPLPRGVLSRSEAMQTAFIIMAIEIALLSYYGRWTFLGAVVVVGYSLIMYKEFFIQNWLREHLTLYAVMHTFVVVFVSVTIFAALFGESFTNMPRGLLYFAFAGWFLFNIFEFGRKTFVKSEEKKGVDSYSKIFGKLGAVLLVLTMGVLSIVFVDKAISLPMNSVLSLYLIPVGVIGLIYGMSSNIRYAKIYRVLTSFYIIFYYGTTMLLVGLNTL